MNGFEMTLDHCFVLMAARRFEFWDSFGKGGRRDDRPTSIAFLSRSSRRVVEKDEVCPLYAILPDLSLQLLVLPPRTFA